MEHYRLLFENWSRMCSTIKLLLVGCIDHSMFDYCSKVSIPSFVIGIFLKLTFAESLV